MFRWSIALIGSALLLGGCAPGHLYIEEGVVESIDQRLEAQDDQINRLNGTQMQVIEQLTVAQEAVISRLQTTIAEQVKPPECKPAPRLVCPQAENNGSLMLGGMEKQLVGEAERVHISPWIWFSMPESIPERLPRHWMLAIFSISNVTVVAGSVLIHGTLKPEKRSLMNVPLSGVSESASLSVMNLNAVLLSNCTLPWAASVIRQNLP